MESSKVQQRFLDYIDYLNTHEWKGTEYNDGMIAGLRIALQLISRMREEERNRQVPERDLLGA